MSTAHYYYESTHAAKGMIKFKVSRKPFIVTQSLEDRGGTEWILQSITYSDDSLPYRAERDPITRFLSSIIKVTGKTSLVNLKVIFQTHIRARTRFYLTYI